VTQAPGEVTVGKVAEGGTAGVSTVTGLRDSFKPDGSRLGVGIQLIAPFDLSSVQAVGAGLGIVTPAGLAVESGLREVDGAMEEGLPGFEVEGPFVSLGLAADGENGCAIGDAIDGSKAGLAVVSTVGAEGVDKSSGLFVCMITGCVFGVTKDGEEAGLRVSSAVVGTVGEDIGEVLGLGLSALDGPLGPATGRSVAEGKPLGMAAGALFGLETGLDT